MTSISKELFKVRWDEYTDKDRVEWLMLNWDACPDFEIQVDNDIVIIVFEDEKELDEPTFLAFDEYGYHLIVPILRGIGLNADFV